MLLLRRLCVTSDSSLFSPQTSSCPLVIVCLACPCGVSKTVSSSRHCFWCLSDLTSYLVLLLTFDLVLTFEICMWPHLAMNSGKSMWKTLLHSCKTEIIRQIIENKTCGKNVSFLFFFSFHKTDLKVLHRDWHSARSLVTIAICVQGHRMLVSNRLLPKTVWEKKKKTVWF